MNQAFYKLKPGVPKQGLFFAAAVVWGYAAFKLLYKAVFFLESDRHLLWFGLAGAIIGFYFFYRYVLYRVTLRYINRIRQLEIRRPCVFGFIDLRGYIIMSFMIVLGILFRRYAPLKDVWIGSFYGAIGLSLFTSTIHYIYSGIHLIRNG
jgi:hypothetical protein